MGNIAVLFLFNFINIKFSGYLVIWKRCYFLVLFFVSVHILFTGFDIAQTRYKVLLESM